MVIENSHQFLGVIFPSHILHLWKPKLGTVMWAKKVNFSHGLRTPNKACFHWNPELLGLGRQIGQKNFGAFGVFSADLSTNIGEFLVHVFHYSTLISTKNKAFTYADILDENTPNAPEFICPICLAKPKSSGFQWKMASLGVLSLWL